jgi:hypothetical protein
MIDFLCYAVNVQTLRFCPTVGILDLMFSWHYCFNNFFFIELSEFALVAEMAKLISIEDDSCTDGRSSC